MQQIDFRCLRLLQSGNLAEEGVHFAICTMEGGKLFKWGKLFRGGNY